MSGFFNDNLLKCKPKKEIVEELGQSMLDTRLRGFYAIFGYYTVVLFESITSLCKWHTSFVLSSNVISKMSTI